MRHWLTEALRGAGVACDDSHANFVLARFADAQTATACDHALREQGLIVRAVGAYKLPHCLRITVGDEPACRQVAHVIGQFMVRRT
jgi:histidinol-phosphate aminotransferase